MEHVQQCQLNRHECAARTCLRSQGETRNKTQKMKTEVPFYLGSKAGAETGEGRGARDWGGRPGTSKETGVEFTDLMTLASLI